MDIKKMQQYVNKSNEKTRKHASSFDSHDKDIKELAIAQDFLQKLKEATGECYTEPKKVVEDPPDFMVETRAGDLVGIEITELVDEEAIKLDIQNETSKYCGNLISWDKDKTIKKLTKIISVKYKKCSKIKDLYKSIILLIHTDEPELPPDRLKQYTNNHNWEKEKFDKVYILIGSDPRDHGRIHLINLK